MFLLIESFISVIVFIITLFAFLAILKDYTEEKNIARLCYVQFFGVLVLKFATTILYISGIIFLNHSTNNYWYPVINETFNTLFYTIFILAIFYSYEFEKKDPKLLIISLPILIVTVSFIIITYWTHAYIENLDFRKFWGYLFFKIWHLIIILANIIYIFKKKRKISVKYTIPIFMIFLISVLIDILNLKYFIEYSKLGSMISTIFIMSGFFLIALKQFKHKLQIKFLLYFLSVILIPGIFVIIYVPFELKVSLETLMMNTGSKIIQNILFDINKILFLSINLGIIIASLTSFLIAEKVLSPINTLIEGLKKISSDKLDHKIQIHTNDEFEIMSDEFNIMSDRLKKNSEKLNYKIEDLNTIHNISKIVNNSTSIEEIFEYLSNTLDANFGIHTFTLMLIDRESNNLEIIKSTHISNKTLDEFSANYKTDIEPFIMSVSDDFTIPDFFKFDEITKFFDISDSERFDFNYCIPIKTMDEIIGLVTVHKLKNYSHFLDYLEELIPVIISQTAPAIRILYDPPKKNEKNEIEKMIQKEISLSDEYSLPTCFANVTVNKFNDDKSFLNAIFENIKNILRKSDYLIQTGLNSVLLVFPLAGLPECNDILNRIFDKLLENQDYKKVEFKKNIICYPEDSKKIKNLIKKLNLK